MNIRLQSVILMIGVAVLTYLYAHYSQVALGLYGKEDISGGIYCTFVDTRLELKRHFIHSSKRYYGVHGCPIYILKDRID